MKTRYVWDKDLQDLVERPYSTVSNCGIMLQPDYKAYECPVTGRMIEGRAAHRENLKRHDCRVLEPSETIKARLARGETFG